MTIQEVIQRIEKWHEPFDNPKTKDVVKCGDPARECTGIAVTCFASVDVIRKAAAQGINLVISHESIFFGDEFQPEEFGDNEVLRKKQQLLEETGIVVWRDHDHIHGMGEPFHPKRYNPDYIFYGIMKELGWEDYVIGDKMKPLWYRLPATTPERLARELMDKMNLNGVRILGDPRAEVSTVFLCEHANAMGKMDADKIRKAEKADVMIPLEICDWTLSEYVRDAVSFGFPKAILEMGHFNFEEPGMKYMVQWLPEAIGEDIPITFIQSGDAFSYVVR